jgi:AraC-like DNA-binding protein
VRQAARIITGRGVTLPGGQPAHVRDGEQVLIALVLGAVERARIVSSMRGRAVTVTFVERIAELAEALRGERRPILAIITEVRDADGRAVHEVVGGLHAGGAGTPLVGYCRAGAEDSNDIRSLVLAGAHRLVFHGTDDSGIALRNILDAAQQASVGERAATELMRVVPEKLKTFVSHVTRYPATQRVTQVAEALGYHRKTLVNHCAQAEFLSPHELLCWCRLAVAGELMARTCRTIESIALQLDFPSDTSLRNMMKRYTGLKASEVRERGGAKCVVAAVRRVPAARRMAQIRAG